MGANTAALRVDGGPAVRGELFIDDAGVERVFAPYSAPVAEVTSAASALALIPYSPHPKPFALWTCAALPGANTIHFKIIEGKRIRLSAQTYTLYNDNGTLTPTETTELAAINAISGLQKRRAVDTSVVELEALQGRIEQASGADEPDINLWYEALVGATYYPVASSDPATCAQVASVLNQLNSYSLIELAVPEPGDGPAPELPLLAQAIDQPPVTPSFEPPQMSVFPGLNSPQAATLTGFPTALRSAYEGINVGVVDIEKNYLSHEKQNFTLLGGGTLSGLQAHAVCAMSTAFGTAMSGETGTRYGTRGFAPRARRAFRPEHDTEWFTTVRDIPEALERAAYSAAVGDVILCEMQIGCSGLCAPIDHYTPTADIIRARTSDGRVFILPMANGEANVGPGADFSGSAPDIGTPWSHSVSVAANTGNGSTRAWFSNHASWTSVNAWGAGVWSATTLAAGVTDASCSRNNLNPAATGSFEAYTKNFGGTSSASAIIAGVSAQILSTFEGTYGRPMGTNTNLRDALVNTMRGSGHYGPESATIGPQPDVLRATSEWVLATRFDGCPAATHSSTGVQPPHQNFMSAMSLGAGFSITSTSMSETGCQFQSNSSTTAGVAFSESSTLTTVGMGPLDAGFNAAGDFSLAARVVVPGANTNWQTIIAKENPRNYGLWVAPTGWAYSGKLHFSYHPTDSPSFCSYMSNRSIDDGSPHDVVVVFDRSTDALVRIYIDGVLDRAVPPCTPGAPRTDGVGGNTTNIGSLLRVNSMVRDVRLYHRALTAGEAAAYAAAF